MPLDRAFKAMLTAPVTLERVTGKDQWGNDAYGPSEPQMTFIDSSGSAFGTDSGNNQQEGTPTTTTQIMFDAVGVKIRDRVTYDAIRHWVTAVDTIKDEVGDDLYQMVTVTNQKEG